MDRPKIYVDKVGLNLPAGSRESNHPLINKLEDALLEITTYYNTGNLEIVFNLNDYYLFNSTQQGELCHRIKATRKLEDDNERS